MPFSWTNNFYWQQAARLEPLLRAALRAPMMDILRAEAASRRQLQLRMAQLEQELASRESGRGSPGHRGSRS